MTSLRVLLVENDPLESERIAGCLERANHAVLSTPGLDEAAQALEIQRFDAVILASTAINEELFSFRSSLENLARAGKTPVYIPVLCYASAASVPPTPAELSRYEVDACLPGDFEAVSFSQLVAQLASRLPSKGEKPEKGKTPLLPVFKAQEFREQVSFDSELIVEIMDLFLADSRAQLQAMRDAMESGDLPALSRVAHSIKGSLGSLYAMQSAAQAQVLEQVSKAGDAEESRAALGLLESHLEALNPELLRLRNAESGL